MVSAINIRTALQKLTSSGEFFQPTFDLLQSCSSSINVEVLAHVMYANLTNLQMAHVLSNLLTIEGGVEGEIEGVDFTNDEINDCCTLFHEICDNYKDILEMAQNL